MCEWLSKLLLRSIKEKSGKFRAINLYCLLVSSQLHQEIAFQLRNYLFQVLSNGLLSELCLKLYDFTGPQEKMCDRLTHSHSNTKIMHGDPKLKVLKY